MRLRDKGLLIVSATMLNLLVLLYLSSHLVLLTGFAKVERQSTERNIGRAVDALNEAINNLSVKSADWAKWDDTYRFVNDHNSEYIESNLPDESLFELKVDLMLFFDTSNTLIFGRGFDRAHSRGVPVSTDILTTITSDTLFMYHPSSESMVAGIIRIQNRLMNIVSRSILTSSGQGPSRGTLIFGSYIDQNEIKRIGQLTHLTVSVYDYQDLSLPPDVTNAKKAIGSRHTPYIFPINESTISGFATIADPHGMPILIVKITLPRTVYQQGLKTRTYLIGSILLAGLLFGLTTIKLIQKVVLSRISQLNAGANSIANSGDHTARVRISGKDEITDLGRSINDMLSALERVEKNINERNLAMRLIMNTVPAGLLSIDDTFIINPEYSRSVETILGKHDLAGMSFFDALGLNDQRIDDKNVLIDFLDTMLHTPMPEQELAVLNPFETFAVTQLDGSVTWLRLRYSIIHRGDHDKPHLLVIIENITEERALSERICQSERENMQLKIIAEDPDLFKDFLMETDATLDRIYKQSGELSVCDDNQMCINMLFRTIHTIKGSAGAFGLSSIVDSAGQLEESLDGLKTTDTGSQDIIDGIRSQLVELSCEIKNIIDNVKRILRDDSVESSDIHLRIPLGKFKYESNELLKLIYEELDDKMVAEQLCKTVEKKIKNLLKVPARRGLAKTLRIVPSLFNKFNKNVTFDIKGEEVLIDFETAWELNVPLIHLLRNAIDHGIESIDERIASGKDIRGHIALTIAADKSSVILQIIDDGRGLDTTLLKKNAVEKGLLTEAEVAEMSDESARNIIFKPGFTTADSTTEISGRGIGMDAVLSVVQNHLNGKILLDSTKGQGTAFTLIIPVPDT